MDDQLIQRLRQAARRKRPWDPLRVLLAFTVFGVAPALIIWWFWPRPHPPELIVVAFDEVARPGHVVKLRAAVEPLDGSGSRWSGLDLFMEEMTAAGGAGDTVKIRTNTQGLAEVEWRLKSPTPVAEIEVRYLDAWRTPPWFERGRCRVFTWPPDARLLVVDVEPTLKNASDWPALSKALAEARKVGWQLGYLAIAADTPLAYRKLRDWTVQQTSLMIDHVPDGPVLARKTLFGGESAELARKEVLAALKTAFPGTLAYITAQRGLELHKVSNGGGVDDHPISLASWGDLGGALAK